MYAFEDDRKNVVLRPEGTAGTLLSRNFAVGALDTTVSVFSLFHSWSSNLGINRHCASHHERGTLELSSTQVFL